MVPEVVGSSPISRPRNYLIIKSLRMYHGDMANLGHENLYKAKKHVWGSKPNDSVLKYVDKLAPGSILDLASGDGRNTIYLAKQGFNITAVDISPTGINNLKDSAEQQGVGEFVTAVVSSIGNYVSDAPLNNSVCTYVLHLLPEEEFGHAIEALANIKENGIVIIEDFLKAPPLYSGVSDKHWVERNELTKYFGKNWNVLEYSEFTTKAKKKDESGNHFEQPAFIFVARKTKG